MARSNPFDRTPSPDDDDFEEGLDDLDMDEFDAKMGGGLSPNGFQRGGRGGEWNAHVQLPRGGQSDKILDRKNEGAITDDEMDEFLEEFDADPREYFRKQMKRMLLMEKKYIDALQKELLLPSTTKSRAEQIRKMLNQATENMLSISESMKIQAKQFKDDHDSTNVATLAEMLEFHKAESLTKMEGEAKKSNRAFDESDPYGFKAIREAQLRKMKDHTTKKED